MATRNERKRKARASAEAHAKSRIDAFVASERSRSRVTPQLSKAQAEAQALDSRAWRGYKSSVVLCENAGARYGGGYAAKRERKVEKRARFSNL